MSFEKFIDDFMAKNGSEDPQKQREAKLACVQEMAAALKVCPPGIAPPHAPDSTLADTCLRLKLYPEALGYYDRALAIAPNDFEVAYAKLYCLLAAKKNRAAVNYAEEILAKTNLSGRPASAKIFAGYLAALVRSNQSTSPKYYQTFTKFLAEQPDSVYAHSYAAHYYNQTKDNKKVQKHVNTIIELAETGDGENSVKGYSADIVEVIAAAALGAIAQRNKKFAWRCIAHLMNSDLAHATVLQLREAASAAFPRPQTPEMNYTL